MIFILSACQETTMSAYSTQTDVHHRIFQQLRIMTCTDSTHIWFSLLNFCDQIKEINFEVFTFGCMTTECTPRVISCWQKITSPWTPELLTLEPLWFKNMITWKIVILQIQLTIEHMQWLILCKNYWVWKYFDTIIQFLLRILTMTGTGYQIHHWIVKPFYVLYALPYNTSFLFVWSNETTNNYFAMVPYLHTMWLWWEAMLICKKWNQNKTQPLKTQEWGHSLFLSSRTFSILHCYHNRKKNYAWWPHQRISCPLAMATL